MQDRAACAFGNAVVLQTTVDALARMPFCLCLVIVTNGVWY